MSEWFLTLLFLLLSIVLLVGLVRIVRLVRIRFFKQYDTWSGSQSSIGDSLSEHSKKEWKARWEERENQVAQQQLFLEKHFQEELHKKEAKILQLEESCKLLEADKVRLETVLEQQSSLQVQLLDQGKHNWEDLGRKQQSEHAKQLEQNLKPLQQQIQYFQQQLTQQYQDGLQSKLQLSEQLKQLKDNTISLSDDAHNLTEALKGSQKKQGAWGEMLLARSLEQSGLRKGIEYQLQKSFINSDGNLFRPDAVVQFPEKRYVVIDAKVSLKAYEAFVASEVKVERDQEIEKHCHSLGQHIKDLAGKEYHKLLGCDQSPDFVLLFCPIEGALAEALRYNPELFEDGFRQNVVLVSPSLLFVVLRIIEQLWRHEKQSRNVAAIYTQAGKIYDKCALFCQDMELLEKQLNTLSKTFFRANDRLYQGRGSFLAQVEKLQALGAETSRQLPVSDLDSEHSNNKS